MGEEKVTVLKAMYVPYIEVVAYSKYIQRPKLQRNINQNKINTCQKLETYLE